MRSQPALLVAIVATLWALAVPSPARGYALDHLLQQTDIGKNKVPHTGTSHILVIPTRVGRSVTFPAARLAELQRFYAPEGGPGTFRSYWQIVSNGRWDPIPTLVAPVLYTDSCPLPERDVDHCKISLSDTTLIAKGGVGVAVAAILARVRDEQNIDLAQFDVNSAGGPQPDGYLDGVIMDSDIYSGIGFPLAALSNEATLPARAGGPMVALGIIALAPPDLHEFGHNLGFVDLYAGPTVNCLMADIHATLSAFSRQQIGWGETRAVNGPLEIDLVPVLDGGPILRVGVPPRYILIENRAGANHAALDSSVAGIYVYSVDEDRMPSSPLGFLDIAHERLYYPNERPPYLNVNLPLNCTLGDGAKRCALREGEERELVHASGEKTGATLRAGTMKADGTVHISIAAPVLDGGAGVPDAAAMADGGGGGCDIGGPGHGHGQRGAPWWVLGLAALLAARRLNAKGRQGRQVDGGAA